MATRWGMIAGAIGLFSAVVGLVQAFSFEHLDTVTCHYIQPGDADNDMLACVRDIPENAGNVVMLDWQTYVGEPHPRSEPEWPRRRPFSRHEEESFIDWYFSGCDDFALELNRTCAVLDTAQNAWVDDPQVKAMVEAQFSTSGAPLPNFPDNGMSIRISGNGQTTNPFSSFETTEGWDVAHGPYQVSRRPGDGSVTYSLSPAPMTDSLSAQVRCAERDWPDWMKFLACPFF